MTPKDWDKIEKLLGHMADQETVETVKSLVEGIEINLKGSLTANVVKSVQRGETTIETEQEKIKNVTIRAVNMDKSFVNVQPFVLSTYDDSVVVKQCVGVLTSSTNLRLSTSVFHGYKVAWEVIEFY